MDDNIWEYPFGEIDDDEDIFYRQPESVRSPLWPLSPPSFNNPKYMH
jgi:hypothetical protein